MAKDKTKPEEAPRFVVTITAPGGSRRRAGFSFGKEPVHLREDELDQEKVKALMSDPLLVVRDYVPPEPDAPATE